MKYFVYGLIAYLHEYLSQDVVDVLVATFFEWVFILVWCAFLATVGATMLLLIFG